MKEEELRELLIVYVICANRPFGEFTFNKFVELIHNPPEEDTFSKMGYSKPNDRSYDCTISLNPEKCTEKHAHFAEDIIKAGEQDYIASSCNVNFIRHYKGINMYIHFNPTFDVFPEEVMFPVVQILNKEFERGECALGNICITE